MYMQSLQQFASKVDELSFFADLHEPEMMDRTTSEDQISEFDPLEVDSATAGACSSKSAENSPKE